MAFCARLLIEFGCKFVNTLHVTSLFLAHLSLGCDVMIFDFASAHPDTHAQTLCNTWTALHCMLHKFTASCHPISQMCCFSLQICIPPLSYLCWTGCNNTLIRRTMNAEVAARWIQVPWLWRAAQTLYMVEVFGRPHSSLVDSSSLSWKCKCFFKAAFLQHQSLPGHRDHPESTGRSF